MLVKRIDAVVLSVALAVALNGLAANAQDASNGNNSASDQNSSQNSGGSSSSTDSNANGGNPAGSGSASTTTTDPSSKPSDWATSDGYDPDKDPSLHPKGQDPRIRMIENARAQQKHEEELKAKKEKEASETKDPKDSKDAKKTDSATVKTTDTATKAGDTKKDGDKKDEKASADKKDDKDKDKDDEKKKKELSEEEKKQKALEKTASSMKYTPLHDALFAMQCGKYSESVNLLSKYVAGNTKDVQAHYLLAVSYVGMRMYTQAIEQYKAVIGLAPNSKVAALASEGLKKIQH